MQIERQVRDLVRSQSLPIGAELPSTRALAADLGVSRGVVVGAYAQLAAEGYLLLRRGAAPTVAAAGREPERELCVGIDVPVARARYNLRPDLPDFALFPRVRWLAASRSSLQQAADTDLAYGEPYGAVKLRRQLAPFLARTRGVLADVDRTGVFAGSTHALLTLASVLRAQGAKRIAVEDPSHRWRTRALVASGSRSCRYRSIATVCASTSSGTSTRSSSVRTTTSRSASRSRRSGVVRSSSGRSEATS